MQVSIDKRELDQLVEKLVKSPEIIREAKRQAFDEAAPKLKKAVDTAIGGTGTVQSWQEQYVGSKGGYAAVRPKAKTFTEVNDKGKRYAVGAVTNAINSGHAGPYQSKRYRKSKYVSGQHYVPGKHFYRKAEAQVPFVAKAAAQQVVDTLMKHLEE